MKYAINFVLTLCCLVCCTHAASPFTPLFNDLLDVINANAALVPRAGSVAKSGAGAAGALAADDPTSVAGTEDQPLRTAAVGRAGAVAVDERKARAQMNGSASSVAKRIVSDGGGGGGVGVDDAAVVGTTTRGQSVDLAAAGTVRGSAVSQNDQSTQQQQQQHAGASVLGGSGSEAGEQAFRSAFGLPIGAALVARIVNRTRDGADDETRGVATATGARTEAALEVASLGLVAPDGATHSSNSSNNTKPFNAGGAAWQAQGKTLDAAGRASTSVGGGGGATAPPPLQNVLLNVSTRGAAGRYGSTRGEAGGTALAYGTEQAEAKLRGQSFGTSFGTLTSRTQAVTYLDRLP
jgi:hypothetical protein